jgi:hypothetical protein
VVAAPGERRAPTRRMLEERFGSAGLERSGQGDWDVMVCAKD